MSIIYKNEFMEEKNFNNSVKRFLKWSQFAEDHLQQGFLMALYTIFTNDLINYLSTTNEIPLRVLLANINESCTQFIHLMIKLYTQIYSLEAIRK
jgi:hypothetical protein